MEQDGYLLLRLSWHYIFRALCACHCVEYFISCVCMCARTHLWAFVCAPSLSCVWLFVTPWTVACPSPLSIEFSRQEHWSGLPFPPSGDLPYPRIEHESLSVSYGDRCILYHWATKEASSPIITINILHSRSHYIYRSHLRKLLCRTFQQPRCRSTVPKKQRWYKIHLYIVSGLFVQSSLFLWTLRK